MCALIFTQKNCFIAEKWSINRIKILKKIWQRYKAIETFKSKHNLAINKKFVHDKKLECFVLSLKILPYKKRESQFVPKSNIKWGGNEILKFLCVKNECTPPTTTNFGAISQYHGCHFNDTDRTVNNGTTDTFICNYLLELDWLIRVNH